MENLRELYQGLFRLTRKQKEVIEAEDYEGLLELLGEKNKLIESINNRNLKEEIKKEEKPQLILAEIKDLMEKIRDLEEKNINILQDKQTEVREKLRDITSKEKRTKGYQKDDSYEAKFIDKKS